MRAAPRGFGLGASLALHGAVAALLILWPAAEHLSGDLAEAQGIAVIYEGAPEWFGEDQARYIVTAADVDSITDALIRWLE